MTPLPHVNRLLLLSFLILVVALLLSLALSSAVPAVAAGVVILLIPIAALYNAKPLDPEQTADESPDSESTTSGQRRAAA